MTASRITVLTPSADRYLIAASDARTRLGLESTDDTLIADLLLESGSMIEHYLDRPLARQRYEERLAGLDGRRLHLSRLPLDPNSLAVTVSEVAETGFTLEDPEQGALYLSGGWPDGDDQTVVATYYAGYLLPGRVADWVAATVKTAGQWVRPTVDSITRLRFECTTAGTTHATTEPAWASIAAGATVTDGTAVWTARDVQELPEDLSRIAWLAVRNLWDLRSRPSGLTRMEADGFAESYSAGSEGDELPGYVMAALDRWRYR